MSTALDIMRAERHISVSNLNTYLRCPKQYEYRYVRRIPVEHRSAALAFGSAIHEALAAYYKSLKLSKMIISVERLLDGFRTAWGLQQRGKLPVLFTEKEPADALTDKGIAMLKCFYENVEIPFEVVEVETPFIIELYDEETGEVLPNLVGVFDAVVRDKDGTHRILEHKTGARRWSEDKLRFDPQITVYHVAAPMMGFGNANVDIQLLLKTKKPGFEVYSPERTATDKTEFVDMAIGIQSAVQAGAFYRRRDWWCNSCDFVGHCGGCQK